MCKYNKYCIILCFSCCLFTKSVLRYVLLRPVSRISMRYIRAHQADQIYRRHIVFFAPSVLTVVCPGGITDTTLKPVDLVVVLHLDNKHRSFGVPAHKVVMVLLVIDDLPLMFRRHILYVGNLPVIGK